jgi:hypothetical protein
MPATEQQKKKLLSDLKMLKRYNPRKWLETVKSLHDMAGGGDGRVDSRGNSMRTISYRNWQDEDFVKVLIELGERKKNEKESTKNDEIKFELQSKTEVVDEQKEFIIEGIETEIVGRFDDKINLKYENYLDPIIGDLSKTDAIKENKQDCIDPYGLVSKKQEGISFEPKMRIAVVTSAWKTQDYIEQFLDSIENNTMHPSIVLIGIDACQETRDSLKKILDSKTYSFKVNVFFSEENVGTYNIRNNLNDIAFNECKCEAIIVVDSDDMIHSEYIKFVHNVLIEKKYQIIGCNLFFNFDHQNNQKNFITAYNTGVNCFTKEIWKKIGYYLPIKAGADSEWLYRCFKLNQTIMVSNSLLYFRRIHANQLTKKIPIGSKNPIRAIAFNLMKNNLILHPKLKKINFKNLKQKSIVGIATWTPRIPTIDKTLESLKDQADEIHVFLNGYNHVPDALPKFKNVFYHHENGKNYGASAKFKFQNVGEADFYFSCDDDIIYPNDYIDKSIEFAKNNPKCLYSYHGTILKENFFKWTRDREFLYGYDQELKEKKYLHVGGSGVMFWNLNDFKIPDVFDHELPNDEIQVINWAHLNKIDILCPTRNKSWIKSNIKTDQNQSLWRQHVKDSQKTDQYIIKNKINLIELKN